MERFCRLSGVALFACQLLTCYFLQLQFVFSVQGFGILVWKLCGGTMWLINSQASGLSFHTLNNEKWSPEALTRTKTTL